jgi:uncharacterized protein YbjT (DUF2867 family)
VHAAPVLIQPMAAEDVAKAVATVVEGPPLNGVVEVGGPEAMRLDELVRRRLASEHDPREVIADPEARYFGAVLGERTLLPGDGARLARTRFEDWLSAALASAP